jgi:FkbM family methyltransferase
MIRHLVRRTTPVALRRALRNAIPASIRDRQVWEREFLRAGFSPERARAAARSDALRKDFHDCGFVHLHPAIRHDLSLVVDVGTNEAQWLSSLMHMTTVGAAELFEPNPDLCRALERKFRDCPTVRVHQVALGTEPGTVPFHITHETVYSSILPPREDLDAMYADPGARTARVVDVPMSTLDREIPSDATIDLLKLDVQGFERAVLEGGRATLARTRMLHMELNLVPHYERDTVIDDLYSLVVRDLGFAFWSILPPYYTADGRALWADAVFVNPQLVPSPTQSPAAHG